MIDLRSDTLTRPTAAMREAIVAAPVGDDVYEEDPTVAELEQRTAELLGHEAGLFCVSGSLANLLGVRLLVEPGQELLCDARAHVVRAELGAHGALSGITTRTWQSEEGVADLSAIEQLVAPDAGPNLVSTAAISLENTHNFGGGTIQPLDHLREVSELGRALGVRLHLDGARLWNAHVATGVSLASYGELFDAVTVCFSKGLGAPMGSILVATAEEIARARVIRKRMGGGWRQAGLMAAGALHALDNHVTRLAEDHHAARSFGQAVAVAAPGSVEPERVATNIVVVQTGIPAAELATRARERGVALSVVGRRTVRAVTHLDVSHADCERAGEIVGDLLRS